MEKLIEFRSVLIKIEEYSWKDSLFLPEDEVWDLCSICAVLNMDDLEDDEENPKFAEDNGLIYALHIGDVQGIVENALEQNPNCSEIDLLNAFLYYYDNDAFITF